MVKVAVFGFRGGTLQLGHGRSWMWAWGRAAKAGGGNLVVAVVEKFGWRCGVAMRCGDDFGVWLDG